MCLMVYISASQPLELVDPAETGGLFFVHPIEEFDFLVQKNFSDPYIYFVGAHEGDGCGFQLGNFTPEDVDWQLVRGSTKFFSEYLTRQLERVEVIHLYACWDGDQAASPEKHRALTPDLFVTEGFLLYEREYSQIRKRIR